MSAQISTQAEPRKASIVVKVFDANGLRTPVSHALIALFRLSAPPARTKPGEQYQLPSDAARIEERRTLENGEVIFSDREPGYYAVAYLHVPRTEVKVVETRAGCIADVILSPDIGASVETVEIQSPNCQPVDCRPAQQGDCMVTKVVHNAIAGAYIDPPPDSGELLHRSTPTQTLFGTPLSKTGPFESLWSIRLPMADAGAAATGSPAVLRMRKVTNVAPRMAIPVTPLAGNFGVALTRTETEVSADLPLWVAIRNGTEALSFNKYQSFIEMLFCPDSNDDLPGFGGMKGEFRRLRRKRFLPFTDTDSYRVLKAATEAFVMVSCSVLDPPGAFNAQADNAYLDRRDLPLIADLPDAFRKYFETLGGNLVLPYLALVRRKLPDIRLIPTSRDDANLCDGIIQDKLTSPCLVELIWSYWQEEGMLVQTINAVARRFQNVRSPGTPDPLANLEIDPLRPLNNLIWGYTQDEQHRLTVSRRNHEYDHHYGLRLQGRAVQMFRPADTRSQFLEGFHHLLRLCTTFYRQDDDTTVKADAFPVLNALKEVHLVMSEGAHNQFGDLPSTARIEMLMQQWLLGRPEFREFLPTRLMVAYPESWMDRVDAMKKLQGWTDTSVVHFRSLAIFGEQLLLTIRYGAWSEVFEPTQAFNWARFWRPQIQGYIHAYRAATGIDLSGDTGDAAADATLPSLLLQRRLAVQRRIA